MMATEILSIPEEHVKAVIKVIREGLEVVSVLEVPRVVQIQLNRWCDEMEEHASSG